MPRFPTYRGELPECLNPLKLRHYFLLAYWVFFRPTALKHYLYPDPKLYRARRGLDIFPTLRLLANRNLYWMVPGTIALFSFLLVLPVRLAISWLQGMPVNWLQWLVFITFISIVSIFSITILGEVEGIILGTAFYMLSSLWFGVEQGIVNSLLFYLSFGIAACIGSSSLFGLAFGVTFGMAFTAIACLLSSWQSYGLLLNLVLIAAIAVGVFRVPFYLVELYPALCSRFRGRVHPIEWDELIIFPLPNTKQILTRRLQQDESNGLILLAEVARNPFQRWAIQSALKTYLHDRPSPLTFLYTLLSFPKLDAYVFGSFGKTLKPFPTTKQLFLGELEGQYVDCSGGSRWEIVERVEYQVWWWTKGWRDLRQTPLTQFAGMLYQLLDEKTVDAEDFDLFSFQNIYTSLTNYPDGTEIANSFQAMATFLSYNNLSSLPAATEVLENLNLTSHTWALETAAIQTNNNEVEPHKPPYHSQTKNDKLHLVRENELGLSSHKFPLLSPVRPTVLTALIHLGEIGQEIASYQDSTSRNNKQAALLRATDALDELDEYVLAQVFPPEQTILRRIIRQWRPLVSEAGGELGRAQFSGPATNPYIVGNPVTGDLFVGRQDILQRLEELWANPTRRPSVVLYGHRRMGKSSILKNLGARFGSQTTIIDFNMQVNSFVANTGELLYQLALELYDSLSPRQQQQIGEPEAQQFTASNPYHSFNRVLKQLALHRGDQRFIITVDEFELIEERIEQQRLDPNLLEYWRGLIQTHPWFVMVFAGLHTLEEMRRHYWHPLYSSVTAIPVSFLTPKAAYRLITQPSPDFDIDYQQEAIQEIIDLTKGQPYLVQLICHTLVTRFNRQTFEQGRERERRFRVEDVEAVINAPEFYRDGDAYFNGVWVQAQESQPEGQLEILQRLCRKPMSVRELVAETSLPQEQVEQALKTLANHDVILCEGENYVYTVELMRRWVEHEQASRLG